MDELLELIMLYRKVWIRGRLGFGKTALSFIIARKLLEERFVDGVVSNCPNVLPVHIDKDDGTLFNRCCVYDEAGQELDARTSMSNNRAYGAYARKLGVVWLFPSVIPIDRRLRSVEISPLYKSMGKTYYRYMLTDGDDRDDPIKGRFSVNLKDAYGIYSTSYIPVGDCGIHDRFMLTYYLATGVKYDSKRDATRAAIETASRESITD